MKTTNETPIRLIVGALIVLLVAPAVMAQEVQKDPERFRAELLGYVQDLGRLSPAVVDRIYKNEFSLVEAEQTVQALTSEELRVMEQNLTLVPFWRELPAMLAEKSLSDPAIQMLRQQSSAQPSQIDPETLRQPMLAFVRALRQMPKELVGDEYHQRIDRVERTISEVDAKQLGELNLAFNERMPVWMEATSNRSGRLRPQTDSHCGSAFPASVVCELNHVFDTIAAIPGQVATFATDAVSFISNELKKLFETVRNAIPTTPSGFLALINLSDPNFQNLLGSIQEIKPPCPTSVPGIGDVGDVRAMYVCQRGPEFLGRALFNIFPKDLWGMKAKIAAGLFYFPFTYLCGTCYAAEYERREDRAHTDHRAHITTNLNVQASTLVTQTSVNAVQGQITNLDGDVAKVEGKLDLLGANTDQQVRQVDVVMTTRASELSVDLGRAEARDVLADVARTEGKLDVIGKEALDLLADQRSTASSLGAFRTLALRQHIEADLIRESGGDRIGIFQTPTAQGGFLEMAIEIVVDTLAKRKAAGVDIREALKEFQKAQSEYNIRAFKSAYTYLRKAYEKAM